MSSLQVMELRACPACSAPSRQKCYEIEGSSVYRCEGCGLKYLDPCLDPSAMKQAYESEACLSALHGFHEGYYDYGDLKTPSKTLSDFDRGLGLLEKNLPGKGKILDIGFGNGFFLASARRNGWKIQGIDSSAANQKIAKEKFGLELLHQGFEDYTAPEIFDAVSFWDVIEHLANPADALKKAATLLKKNGLLLIAVPNDRSLLALLAASCYRLGFKKMINKIYFLEHVCYYSPQTLAKLLSQNGFLLKDFFLTSTDLAKYKLSLPDRLLASGVLLAGQATGLQNRLVALFQKS